MKELITDKFVNIQGTLINKDSLKKMDEDFFIKTYTGILMNPELAWNEASKFIVKEKSKQKKSNKTDK